MDTINLKVDQFEGPLDLLLTLITKHKIDIFDIPISEIAEQYLAELEKMRKLDMEITSEFLVMASELMLIKSKLLLPRAPEEEDPRKPLVDALLEHQRAIKASQFLREQSIGHYDTFTTPACEPLHEDYSREHKVSLLTEAFARISERLAERLNEKEPELFKKIGEERYFTVEEKTQEILTKLEKSKTLYFDELFLNVSGRGEAVAIFLALLETVRDGYIDAEREGENVMLSYIGRPAENNKQEVLNEYE